MKCKWLPPLIPCENLGEFIAYDNYLYSIFRRDFIETHPEFQSYPVNIRRHPLQNGKEYTYFHVTSKDYDENTERCPDIRRCERIRWIRAFIENYFCDPTLCQDCDGIKYFEVPYKQTQRIYLFFEEEEYVVVLERREHYFLLITAFYVDYPNTRRKLLKKYNQYKTKGA